MNIEIWCKSFLSIYNIIPNLVKSIDKLVYLKSISSAGFSRNDPDDTYNQVEKIACLTQKKINLINLKLLCDEILLEMNKDAGKLILLRYIDDLPCEEIINLLHLTRRTYFRKLSNALKNFELRLYSKIIKNNVLYNNFITDNFFNDIFEKINLFEEKVNTNKNSNNFTFQNSLCNMILKQMKKAF